MSEAFETIVWYVVCGAIGYAAGTIIQYRQYRLGRVSMVVPFVTKSSRNFTIVVVTLSLLTTFSVVTSQVQQQHQAQCNIDFRSALRENSRINTEDRDLERRDDALRERRDDAMDDLVKGLMASPNGAQTVLALLTHYDQTVSDIGVERADLDRARSDLEQQRRNNPYPEPRCD